VTLLWQTTFRKSRFLNNQSLFSMATAHCLLNVNLNSRASVWKPAAYETIDMPRHLTKTNKALAASVATHPRATWVSFHLFSRNPEVAAGRDDVTSSRCPTLCCTLSREMIGFPAEKSRSALFVTSSG